MKVKINNLKLIVKKEKGGELISMAKKGQTTTRWSNGNGYKSYPLRNSTGQDFYGYSGNDLLTAGMYGIRHSYTKNNLNYGLNTTYRTNRDLKMGNLTVKKGLSFRVRRDGDRWKGNYILDIFNSPVTETTYEKPLKQNKGPVKGKWFIAQNDWSYNGRKIKKGDTYLISTKDNSVTIKPKNKPAGTQDGGIKGGIRGNARTTAKPATTTFTESPTNITDQSWLDARNAAMQRGWGTYNYNGLTYRFTGDEFLQAKRNWNNRRKAGYQAEGILNLPSINVPDNLVFDNNYARKIESTVPLTKPVNTKTTPITYWYQRGTLAKNPEITREALWQATQAVRNGDRDASYYGESSDLVSQLANANQDSAKNYIYNLWNTNNDVATQAGRKNYTESQGLTFGEPTTNNTNKDPLQSWATDFLKRSARQGTKLISRKQ